MFPLQNLIFQERAFSLRMVDGKQLIFDICRKKYVLLTPEEWVRQHLIWTLVYDFKYPKGKFAIEKWVTLGERRKRFDALVYDGESHPWLLIECKEPDVPITNATIIQLLQYQSAIGASYLMLTNGKDSFLALVTDKKIVWQKNLPDYFG